MKGFLLQVAINSVLIATLVILVAILLYMLEAIGITIRIF